MTNIIASGLETSVDVATVAAIGGFLAVIYVIGLLSNYLQAFLFTTAIQRFFRAFENSDCRENLIAFH